MPVLPLEVKFQSKLKLSRVVRCCWAAVVTAIVGALAKGIYIAKQRRCRSFVEAIEHIKAFGDQIQSDTLAETNGPHDAQVERSKLMRDSHISCKAAVREERW